MIQSLTEQKRPLGIFVSEYGLPDTLTAHQWILLENVLSVLGPFKELTEKVSSSDAMAADVIPAVTVLHRFLTRETDEDHGIKAMKGKLAAAVRYRFTDVEENPYYSIATLHDPGECVPVCVTVCDCNCVTVCNCVCVCVCVTACNCDSE